MIHGTGIDILKTDKLTFVSERADDPFIVRTFTASEREAADGRELPLYFYATRFAGKEAVFKALRISGEDVDLSEIEILNDKKGAPYVNLYGKLKDYAMENGLKIHISLSYEDDTAIAMAIAEKM